MSKTVLVQVNSQGDPIRIIKTAKLARLLPVKEVAEWPKADAVRSIRRQIYERSKNAEGYPECEWCSRGLPWTLGQMHERIARGARDENGNSGEVSLANSVWICQDCHFNSEQGHGNRQWQTARLKEQ